jgi:hypothetical protein
MSSTTVDLLQQCLQRTTGLGLDVTASQTILWAIFVADCRDTNRRDPQIATTIIQDIERKHQRLRGILGQKRASADLQGHRATYGSDPYSTRI